jgi:hypothetical protein
MKGVQMSKPPAVRLAAELARAKAELAKRNTRIKRLNQQIQIMRWKILNWPAK